MAGMEAYRWQDKVYQLWEDNGFIGIVSSSTGSGKTRAGAIALKRYMDSHPDDVPLILTPSSKVGKSWESELEVQGISAVSVMTYQTAVNRMRRDADFRCDVMIADECHRLCTPVQGQVLNLNPKAILGLSATPEGSVEILGPPFMEIPITEANICPFTIHYVTFTPTDTEMERYNKATENMRKRALEVSGGRKDYLKPGADSVGWNSYDALSRKRREVCYLMSSRIGHVVDIISRNPDRRTVVYFERTKQVSELHDALLLRGMESATHTQEGSTIERFEKGDVNILIACKSLREGWNDPAIDRVIMGSINTRTIVNTQTIGRALRLNPDDPHKHADIYLLMAEGTSDVNVTRNLDYPKQNIRSEHI